MGEKFTLEQNSAYWEDLNTVSIVDRNLHELEIAFISKFLAPEQIAVDIGCGDGLATFRFAEKVKFCFGIERSDYLRSKAEESLRECVANNISFTSGDILDLSQYKNQFDVAITQRVLINLPSWNLQTQAIENVHKCLKKGGIYLLTECTYDGNEVLNQYRDRAGLEPIELHWHNEYIHFEVFHKFIDKKFILIETRGFNLYYFLTRVYMQMFASITGSGMKLKADPIFVEADKAARELFEKCDPRIRFLENVVLGPLQGFALKKL